MIELERHNLAVMMEAGYIYLGMRRFKEARALFEGLAALAPDSDVPYVAIGNVDFCEGKISKAIKRYRQALKLDPASVFAQVYLGEALLFAGQQDEAMKIITAVANEDQGGAGEFARALHDAVKAGFEPGQKQRGAKGRNA